MDFWAAVGLASAFATALATGVSTLVALWWRRTDRTGADWLPFHAFTTWNNDERTGMDSPRCSFTLANSGDGVAFRLSVLGVGCHAQLLDPSPGDRVFGPRHTEVVPAFPPGATNEVRVVCDPSHWDEAAVRVRWVESPTWRGKVRERDLLLNAIAPKPRMKLTVWNEQTGTQDTVETLDPPGFVMPDSYPPQLPPLDARQIRKLRRLSR